MRTPSYAYLFPLVSRSFLPFETSVAATSLAVSRQTVDRWFAFNYHWLRTGYVKSHLQTSFCAERTEVRVYYFSSPVRYSKLVSFLFQLRPLFSFFGFRESVTLRLVRASLKKVKGYYRRRGRTFLPAVMTADQTEFGRLTVTSYWNRLLTVLSYSSLTAGQTSLLFFRLRQVTLVWVSLPNEVTFGSNSITSLLRYRLQKTEGRMRLIAVPLLKLTQAAKLIVGASVRCHGRFTRKQRADHKVYRWGKIKASSYQAYHEQSFFNLKLKFGTVGITLLVNYGG